MPKTLSKLIFSNSFAALGDAFSSRVKPTPFSTASRLVHVNHRASKLLDLDSDFHHDANFLDIVSGKQILSNSEPISMLYAGHQFGHFVPQLGDGRAIILAEVCTRQDQTWELQLKGSGLTPYSRDGDGRAVLRSSIREYLCSEAMHGLGIATTQALCLVANDDEIFRETIEPGAVVTRMAQSHVRFGSFEVFYYRNQYDHIRTLADYVIDSHFPDLAVGEQCYAQWLEQVVDRTAYMIAQWQAVGFAHGVMNTDNMSVLGLTIDYGPFGFMERYDPGYICNHSDHHGRYAFDQQANIGLFNISCFAQAILPILDDDADKAVAIAKEKIEMFQARYLHYYARAMRDKLGLQKSLSEDESLVNELLNLMAKDRVDFTTLFRQLCSFSSERDNENHAIRDGFIHRELFAAWADKYRQRLSQEDQNDQARAQQMKQVNPKYILRNYMAEIAIQKAQNQRDYSEIDRLMQLLASPYEEHPDMEHYAAEPPEWASEISVSCSS